MTDLHKKWETCNG